MTTISIGKGLLGITVFLVACGLVLGLTLGNVDLANPITSSAESRRAEVETQQLAQQNDIDLQQYKVLQEAHTQAETARLEEDTRRLQQIHEQEIQHLQQVREQEIRQIQKQTALKSQLCSWPGTPSSLSWDYRSWQLAPASAFTSSNELLPPLPNVLLHWTPSANGRRSRPPDNASGNAGKENRGSTKFNPITVTCSEEILLLEKRSSARTIIECCVLPDR